MEFICPKCGEKSDYLNVMVVDIVQFSTANLPEEGQEGILFGDYETEYDDSHDNYYCPNCDFELIGIHDEDALLDYVREQKND